MLLGGFRARCIALLSDLGGAATSAVASGVVITAVDARIHVCCVAASLAMVCMNAFAATHRHTVEGPGSPAHCHAIRVHRRSSRGGGGHRGWGWSRHRCSLSLARPDAVVALSLADASATRHVGGDATLFTLGKGAGLTLAVAAAKPLLLTAGLIATRQVRALAL